MLRVNSVLHANKIFGGPVSYRRFQTTTRSQPDRGMIQPLDRGTDAFNTKYMRSRVPGRHLTSAKAIQAQRARVARSSEMDGRVDDFTRARELSNFAEPQTADEAAFLEAEFEREMQLKAQPSESELRRNRHRDRSSSSSNPADSGAAAAAAANSGSRAERKDSVTKLPAGLNPPRGPETNLRPRRALAMTDVSQRASQNDVPYTVQMHRARTNEDARMLRNRFKYAQTPTHQEYGKAIHALRSDAQTDETVAELQDRLVEENGLYPTQRLDAFMLRDEAAFPQWVNELPPFLKDRVRYGGVGLTESDEVLRQNLAKMPRDEREREWARLKAAREYRLGEGDKRISGSEMRQLRLGIRRHHQLHHRRLQRATLLKRLALRTPDQFEVWPTRDVDYSARLGRVAQFVEAGVPTMGEWPLDQRKLENARKKKRVAQEAEREFVRAGVALPHVGGGGSGMEARMGHTARAVLARLESRERDVKRISRRHYTRRFNAIRLGYRDEHGRKFYAMQRWGRERRIAAFANEDELRMSREAAHASVLTSSMLGRAGSSRGQLPMEPVHGFAEERRDVGGASRFGAGEN
jgi:hypothetical protein